MNRKVKFMYMLFVSLFISSSLLCGISSAEPEEPEEQEEIAIGADYSAVGEEVVETDDAADEETNSNSGTTPTSTGSPVEINIDFSGGGSFWEAGAEGAEEIIRVVDGNSDNFVYIQSIIIYIGIIVAVVVTTIYGIQWLMATPAKKQQLKQSLVPLIIGVALLAIGPKLTITLVKTFMVLN